MATYSEKVLKELVGNYEVDEAAAKALLKKHDEEVRRAGFVLSAPYYPAGKIAEAEGLKYHGRLDEAEPNAGEDAEEDGE